MSVGSIGWKTLYNAAKGYTKRAAQLYPNFVAGTANDVMSNAMKSRIKNRALNNESWFKAVKNGFKDGILKAEKFNKNQLSNNGGSNWKMFKNNLKNIFPKVGNGWKAGTRLASIKGKNKFFYGLRGACKGLGKSMPLIGTLILAVTSLPDIFKATANEGIVSGAGEVVKVAARVGGGTLGAAIGTAVLGPVGGFVGYALGDWVTKKIVGASYSERQIEQEEKIAKKLEEKRQEEAANASTSGGIDYSTVSPEAMMQLQQILYGGNGNIFEQDFYSNPFATMSQQNTTIAQETQNK